MSAISEATRDQSFRPIKSHRHPLSFLQHRDLACLELPKMSQPRNYWESKDRLAWAALYLPSQPLIEETAGMQSHRTSLWAARPVQCHWAARQRGGMSTLRPLHSETAATFSGWVIGAWRGHSHPSRFFPFLLPPSFCSQAGPQASISTSFCAHWDWGVAWMPPPGQAPNGGDDDSSPCKAWAPQGFSTTASSRSPFWRRHPHRALVPTRAGWRQRSPEQQPGSNGRGRKNKGAGGKIRMDGMATPHLSDPEKVVA